MKRNSLLTIALSLAFAINAQTAKDACTSIMVGKDASADGSVITSHTCDSWYRTWMSIEPAADYKNDTVMSIYEGLMHTEKHGDMTGVKPKGQIPQAKHTYRFLNTAYPCMNEHQLAIGETTIVGRDTLQNKMGMFMIEELQRIVLQRCTTARDAIRLIGELVKKYGYGDSGECLTIADPNEVWIFEIFGEGPKKIGGVWAAQRIPDDHVAVSANISRISKINLKDTANLMASENVFDVARKMGFWDGKSEFCFWFAYSGNNYFGEKKNYSVRELFIMQQLAPNAGFNKDMEELPVSVKPEHKVSVAEVSRLLGSYYEGTELNLSGRLKIKDKSGDSIVSPVANPWMRPDEINLYYALGDSAMKNIRTVSVSWCAYSTVIQLRSWLPDAIGGVAWIALDCPGESPRFPIFAGTTKLPAMLGICGQHSDRDDAALTHFRHANRMATVRWGKTRKDIEDGQKYFMDKGMRELNFVEKTWLTMPEEEREEMLNGYVSDFLGAEILRWDELAHKFWRTFWGGF